MEILEGFHQHPLTILHLLTSLFGFDYASFELSLTLFSGLVLLFSLQLSLLYLLLVSGCLILLGLELFSSGLEFFLAYL